MVLVLVHFGFDMQISMALLISVRRLANDEAGVFTHIRIVVLTDTLVYRLTSCRS